MTDVEFMVKADDILTRRPTALRDLMLKRLERRALYEEALDAARTLASEMDAALYVIRRSRPSRGW